MSAFGGEFNIPKEFGLYLGSVIRNDDPDRLGRIKANIPVLRETPWCWPVGFPGGGSEGAGAFAVPRPGATVLVGFVQGDKRQLFYMAGPHRIRDGAIGTPQSVSEETSVTETPNIRAFETETFEVVIKDTAAEKKLILRTKPDPNDAVAGVEIELDANDESVLVRSGTYIVLEAPTGIVDITAQQVQIQGRIVKLVGDPI